MGNEQIKVEVKNLCKNYGALEVLKDCSFNIKKGEFVCVVGPTGCGKTTFLNALTCLIPLTSGEILIEGEPADPKKTQPFIRFSGAFCFPVADGRGQYTFRPENQKIPQGVY